MKKIEGQIVFTEGHGKQIQFFVQNPEDAVQGFHHNGNFYEKKDLDLISRYLPEGSHYVDIGANVGNHAIFVAKYLRPASVVVFEPSPEAIDILKTNLKLNDLQSMVDISNLGVGLGDEQGSLHFKRGTTNNLGASKFTTDISAQEIKVRRGDDVLIGQRVDFMKIDVEGFELKALAGLEETIENNRPIIYIEVDDRNTSKFIAWLKENRYAIIERIRHYAVNENFLIAAEERLPLQKNRRIGIGITTYNRKDYLNKVIDAVLKNTTSPFYLLVADDGSSDGSSAAAASKGICAVGGENRGIAWNKNRALYTLFEKTDADVFIILEDDTLPNSAGWEKLWIEAAEKYGYVTYAHPKVHDAILCGDGTPASPYGCTKITSQCAAASRAAVAKIGFFDTRFRGYGVEDGEWTTRFRNSGFGIVSAPVAGEPNQPPIKANAMIDGGVETLDAQTFRDNVSVEQNRILFKEIRNDPIPRLAWRSEAERKILHHEINLAFKRTKPEIFFP